MAGHSQSNYRPTASQSVSQATRFIRINEKVLGESTVGDKETEGGRNQPTNQLAPVSVEWVPVCPLSSCSARLSVRLQIQLIPPTWLCLSGDEFKFNFYVLDEGEGREGKDHEEEPLKSYWRLLLLTEWLFFFSASSAAVALLRLVLFIPRLSF